MFYDGYSFAGFWSLNVSRADFRASTSRLVSLT